MSTPKTMSDGGKGSVRRNEDTQKVLEGYSRIFGESKLDRKLREEAAAKGEDTVLTLNEKEEREAMNDIREDFENDEGEWTCEVCGGPMYRQSHWSYGQCDDCGARQELEDDNY
jgi:rubrerythrin